MATLVPDTSKRLMKTRFICRQELLAGGKERMIQYALRELVNSALYKTMEDSIRRIT